jgi:Transposase, Mutator family
VSPSTVSNLNKKIYAKIEAWRNRRIEARIRKPYLYLDGLKSYRDNTVNAYVLDVDKTITMCATSKECLSHFLKLTSNHIHLNTSSAG